MAASIGDLITAVMNGGAPVPTTVSSIRTPGATTLACVALTHWPVVSAVHFVTGTPMTDAEGNAVINPTSLALWKAIVSGTTLTGLFLEASATGSDPGNSVNDIVQMAPDSAWAQDLFTALTAEHNTVGNHTQAMTINGDNVWNILTQEWVPSNETWAFASSTTITVPSNATLKYQIGDLLQLTQSATVKYFVVTAVSATVLTVVGLLGATLVNSTISANSYAHTAPFGSPLGGVAFVPYNFSCYRNAAYTMPNNGFNKVPFDTKVYDTGSNLDVTTNIGRFTATVAGIYQFSTNIGVGISDTDDVAAFYKNGANYRWGNEAHGGGTGGTAQIPLAAGDYVEIWVSTNVLPLNVGNAPQKTWFDGRIISLA